MDAAKLKWRCRRGIKEFDVLFNRFLENDYPLLTEEQQAWFHQILDEQDPVIMDWLFKRSEPQDEGLKWIIEKLQTCSESIS
ncbi:MAG: succinate dehydrogenase assembly factor 2 [Arenicella sp.]